MPFDNARENPHQRLMDLEDKLRKGGFPFMWQYTNCEACAMEIDNLGEKGVLKSYETIGIYYGIDADQALRIFAGAYRGTSKRMIDITPEDVANVVHEVLSEKVYA